MKKFKVSHNTLYLGFSGAHFPLVYACKGKDDFEQCDAALRVLARKANKGDMIARRVVLSQKEEARRALENQFPTFGIQYAETCPVCGQLIVRDWTRCYNSLMRYSLIREGIKKGWRLVGDAIDGDSHDGTITLVTGVSRTPHKRCCDTFKITAIQKKEWMAEYSANFSGITFIHGLSAFSRTHSPEEIQGRIKNINTHPEWELCACAGAKGDVNYCGPFGLYITGEVTGAFANDVYSFVHPKWGRIPLFDTQAGYDEVEGGTYADFCIQSPNGWYGDDECPCIHTEAFVRKASIKGVWVRDYFYTQERTQDAVAVLKAAAKSLHVPLFIIVSDDKERWAAMPIPEDEWRFENVITFSGNTANRWSDELAADGY